MKNLLIPIIILLTLSNSFSQEFPEKELLEVLNASKISMDHGNGDGVFKAKSRKTKKWGMYQYLYEGVKVKEVIPMDYDSLKYFPFNGAFTVVYNNGKVGFYLAEWSYGDKAKQSVACLYDNYKRFTANNTTHLAASKNGKWGWVDWLTGEEKSDFIYDSKDELPYPKYEQKSWFDK
jgi:hypothetical protein